MPHTVAHWEFETSAFLDHAETRAQRVNGHIGSLSLATWLCEELKQRGWNASAPWEEDHGCDFSVTADAKRYLCVCHTDDEEAAVAKGSRYAYVLVVQVRSLMDRVLGRNRVEPTDPLGADVGAILAAHPAITALKSMAA